MTLINMNDVKSKLLKQDVKNVVLLVHLNDPDAVKVISFTMNDGSEPLPVTDAQIKALVPDCAVDENNDIIKSVYVFDTEDDIFMAQYMFDYSAYEWFHINDLNVEYDYSTCGSNTFRYKTPEVSVFLNNINDNPLPVSVEAAGIIVKYNDNEKDYSILRREMLVKHNGDYYLIASVHTIFTNDTGENIGKCELYPCHEYDSLEEAILVKMNFPNYKFATHEYSFPLTALRSYLDSDICSNEPLDVIKIG